MSGHIKTTLRAGVCALALTGAGGAQATEGYFVEGVSARDQALGGAGIASPADALINATNPAGLVDVGHQMTGDVSLFNPTRGYDASGTMPHRARPCRERPRHLRHSRARLFASARRRPRLRHQHVRQWRHEHHLWRRPHQQRAGLRGRQRRVLRGPHRRRSQPGADLRRLRPTFRRCLHRRRAGHRRAGVLGLRAAAPWPACPPSRAN